MENVGFVLEISKEGDLVQEYDIREQMGANLRPKLIKIPYTNEVNVRANNVEANFLVDKAAYLLGNDLKTKVDRLQKSHRAFKDLFNKVTQGVNDNGIIAVKQFYAKWDPDLASSVIKYWSEMAGNNAGFLAFKLEDDLCYIHEREAVVNEWTKYVINRKPDKNGQCLVSGEIGPIQRLHAQFKGLRGGQSSGKSIVSVNFDSAESYNKTQAFNSPVSVKAEFKRSSALKSLIRSAGQKIYINDCAVLFWTERDSPIEGFFGMILDPRDTTSDDRELAIFLESIREGKWSTDYDPNINFYIL